MWGGEWLSEPAPHTAYPTGHSPLATGPMRIFDLEPGAAYVVRQPFRDDRGTLVLEGDRQTFVRVRLVPVSGEIEVTFREETRGLREDRQPDVVEHAERFFAPA